MHIIGESHGHYVFNLARGEELFTTLLAWAETHDLKAATLTGLGATNTIELAYYNLTTKEYERHVISENLEVLSLTGNLGVLDDKKILHIHGVFGRQDLSTLGGHLFSLTVSGACEIHLQAYNTAFERVFNEETGLNLFCGKEVL